MSCTPPPDSPTAICSCGQAASDTASVDTDPAGGCLAGNSRIIAIAVAAAIGSAVGASALPEPVAAAGGDAAGAPLAARMAAGSHSRSVAPSGEEMSPPTVASSLRPCVDKLVIFQGLITLWLAVVWRCRGQNSAVTKSNDLEKA